MIETLIVLCEAAFEEWLEAKQLLEGFRAAGALPETRALVDQVAAREAILRVACRAAARLTGTTNLIFFWEQRYGDSRMGEIARVVKL